MRINSRVLGCGLLLSILGIPAVIPMRGQSPQEPPSRIDPAARKALDQAIRAMGGEAFINFKTLTTTGRAFAISEGGTSGMLTFTSQVQYPDKRRFSYGKARPVVLINDGNQGWEVDRMGVIRQKPNELRRWQLANRYGLENLFRVVLREPGVLVEDGGSDFMELQPVHVIDIVDTRHMHVKLYLSEKTSLPVRIAYRVQDPETQEWDTFAEAYSEYKTVERILTPTHIVRYQDDRRVAEFFRNTVAYNQEYPAGIFAP